MVVKTFRGILANDGEDRIKLSTINGKVGYRIVKFQLMGPYGDTNVESVVKIYKTSVTASTDIDFTDSNLLAAGIINDSASNLYLPPPVIVFDTEIFNQDIYITNKGHSETASINYYIELEVIPLSDQGAEYTTIKDLRANA